jgi:hypothetical protein
MEAKTLIERKIFKKEGFIKLYNDSKDGNGTLTFTGEFSTNGICPKFINGEGEKVETELIAGVEHRITLFCNGKVILQITEGKISQMVRHFKRTRELNKFITTITVNGFLTNKEVDFELPVRIRIVLTFADYEESFGTYVADAIEF